LIRVL